MNDSSKTNKAARLLAESVSQLMNSETYKAALQFRNKFHAYSMRNVWLIYTQCPTATYVAGYHRWLELGRHVRKGESGISILAPMTRKAKDDEGSDTKHIFGFKTATVFNLEQTDGDSLPELPTPQLLELDSEGIQQTLKALEHYAQTQDITIIKTSFSSTALGSYHYRSNTINLRNDLPPLQELKTTIHELGHALMHRKDDNKPRHVKELEAESCAFLTCEALGLDSSSYSFPYLSIWADDPGEILPAAERACKVADEILEQLRTINVSPIELPLAA
jgi:antirestriction protein ArdC